MALTAAIVVAALASCATRLNQPAHPEYTLTPLTSGTVASLRGLSVVSPHTAWASGSGGTVLRTTDGGATWLPRNVSGADSLDFRDVEAFDALTAYVLSAGEDGRIYKTTDGGNNWTLQFRNRTPGAFFDCLAFWDARNGLAVSDPVDDRFLMLRTADGETWHELAEASRPVTRTGEAAFAASGTCLVTAGARVFLATGGAGVGRVFVSDDRGESWQDSPTPVPAATASAGIFSLAFRDAENGIAIGGDYRNPAAPAVVAMTGNGSRSWTVAGRTPYVSGATVAPANQTIVAVGTVGTRVSTNRGVTWLPIDTVEYNAVQLAADGTGYVVGPRGRIAKLLVR